MFNEYDGQELRKFVVQQSLRVCLDADGIFYVTKSPRPSVHILPVYNRPEFYFDIYSTEGCEPGHPNARLYLEPEPGAGPSTTRISVLKSNIPSEEILRSLEVARTGVEVFTRFKELPLQQTYFLGNLVKDNLQYWTQNGEAQFIEAGITPEVVRGLSDQLTRSSIIWGYLRQLLAKKNYLGYLENPSPA